jgi:hypothetical protein
MCCYQQGAASLAMRCRSLRLSQQRGRCISIFCRVVCLKDMLGLSKMLDCSKRSSAWQGEAVQPAAPAACRRHTPRCTRPLPPCGAHLPSGAPHQHSSAAAAPAEEKTGRRQQGRSAKPGPACTESTSKGERCRGLIRFDKHPCLLAVRTHLGAPFRPSPESSASLTAVGVAELVGAARQRHLATRTCLRRLIRPRIPAHSLASALQMIPASRADSSPVTVCCVPLLSE